MNYFEIPEIYQDASHKNVKLSQAQADEINLWMRHKNAPMVFTGAPGRGKTYTAIAVYNQRQKTLVEATKKEVLAPLLPQYNSLFCNMSKLFHAYKQNYEKGWMLDKLLKQVVFPELLILDDLGLREPSPGFADFLYSVVDERVSRHRDLTLVTTNCTSKEISELYGDRFASRIATGYCVKFEGDDLRKKKRSF